MQAAYVRRYGANERLSVGEVPEPAAPGADDVLVEVRAASVNPVDFKVRNGQLKLIKRYAFPLVLGHDLAGVVRAVGAGVRGFKPGDEVYARPGRRGIGSFAERIVVDAAELALKPRSLSFEQAAALPLVGLIGWQALAEVAQVQPGQRVFIHAGSGGLGSFAIQLARHLGATVTATTSTRNLELVRSLGADRVIDYTRDDVLQAAGQDVVLDTLGGPATAQSFQLVRRGGLVISLPSAPDPLSVQQMGLGLLPRLLLRLASSRPRKLAARREAGYRAFFVRPNGAQLARIAELVDAGAIQPVIDSVFSLQQAQQALERCESGRARGKVIVSVSGSV